MNTPVYYHVWPWSLSNPSETLKIGETAVSLPYFGSPVLTAVADEVILPTRFEKFHHFGPAHSLGNSFILPHGTLSRDKVYSFRLKKDLRYIAIVLKAIDGAVDQYTHLKNGEKRDSDTYDLVQEWAAFFDEIIESGLAEATPQQLNDFLNNLSDLQEPRMELIVKIAEDMNKCVADLIRSPRRVLTRERSMVAINKIDELDSQCLRWFVRQPGETFIEKAGPKQELLGVVRRSTTETLENKVLKDFIRRCERLSRSYLSSVRRLSKYLRSKRTSSVERFRRICESGKDSENLLEVTFPSPGFQPNYVLQRDVRYSRVWEWYRKLLKKERELDSVWDWQARTWSDIGSCLVALAFCTLKNDRIRVVSVLESHFQFSADQDRGSYFMAGSLPGPFILDYTGGERRVLELVHYDNASVHNECKKLGHLGGHLYCVINRLNSKVVTDFVVFWFVNTLASKHIISSESMASSAKNSLDATNGKKLKGVILRSCRDHSGVESFYNGQIQIVSIVVAPSSWSKVLSEHLLTVIDKALVE